MPSPYEHSEYLARLLAPFLTKLGAASGTLAQEVELSAACVSAAHDLYFFDAGRAHQEGTLNTNAMRRGTSNRKAGIVATPFDADHRTGKHLDTFAVTLDDERMYAHAVAGAKINRDVRIILGLKSFDQIFHRYYSLEIAGGGFSTPASSHHILT